MRVVLDSNILVSALITPSGLARRVVQAGIAGRYELIVCPMLMGELEDVARRPKIAVRLPPGAAERFVVNLRGGAHGEPDPEIVEAVSRDPDDDYLLAFAKSVQADRLVTGDDDLLALTDSPVPVTTLRSFADLLDREAT